MIIGKKTKKKVYLGGTMNESYWREELIAMLNIDYFDPTVDDWTPECVEEEKRQRSICDYCLTVITPEMTGVYSIAEAVDDSNKRPSKTVFCVLQEYYGKSFDYGQMLSLNNTGKMIVENGGKYFNSLVEVANFLNK